MNDERLKNRLAVYLYRTFQSRRWLRPDGFLITKHNVDFARLKKETGATQKKLKEVYSAVITDEGFFKPLEPSGSLREQQYPHLRARVPGEKTQKALELEKEEQKEQQKREMIAVSRVLKEILSGNETI